MKSILNRSRFQGIARAMTRNYDVNVVFAGTCPKTDGRRTIYLPANADSLPGHTQDSLEGWLDHEGCHVEQEVEAERNGTTSPMALMNGPAAARGPKAQLLLNVYEDIRIEARKSRTHPGVAENLSRINQRSIQRYLAGTTGDVWQDIAGALIATGRNLDTSWISGPVKTIIERCADEVAAMSAMSTPDDAWALAQTTLDKIEALQEEMEQEQQNRQEPEAGDDDNDSDDDESGERDDSGDDGDEDAAGGNEGDDDDSDDDGDSEAQGDDNGSEDGSEGGGGTPDDEGDGDGVADSGEGDDGDGENDGDGGECDSKGKAKASDLGDNEVDELVDTLKEAENNGPSVIDFLNHFKGDIDIPAVDDMANHGRVIPTAEVAAQDGFVDAPIGNLGQFLEAKTDVDSQIGTLRRKLTTALQVRTQAHFQGDKDEGELDQDSLFALKSGDHRVFAQKTKASKTDTAVTLLVDLSASMGHCQTRTTSTGNRKSGQDRAWYAMRTAIALAETLSSIGVPFEVLGFYNEGGDMPLGSHAQEFWIKQHGANRWQPFKVVPFKQFNEAYKRCRARFADMSGRGNNGDGDAVMFAAKRLAQRPETRKLLIVISDGQPNGPAPEEALQADLKRVVREVTASGIEVFGIGANTLSVRDYYNEDTGASNVVINDLDNLAVCVFKLLRAKLMRRAA